ncbi:dTDP-4-dehydrorhamnose 3,5-epimerase family protein [Herminiimonas contaminans]|uniref:dTDP-4-dehydrorhamnose 3,5-epimerase n=1 Tax=Herminiimonas contaminans TaxID=1111140 RepID=A0ABS0EQ70_9BURK|nr:dTDP-4-dehydrorhamnose 3,5-epimerase family protein [Herminiimonas contaminans]MBF8176673.1 dTDP-4-dehydrorhamnose 3,5-epimerase family protein [Herminiimonas contaminans]
MSNRFDIQTTQLADLNVLVRKPLGDSRGYLERMFCVNELQDIFGARRIVQINHTLTQNKGTVRGMHFQYAPHAEMKFVSCLQGSVFDVVIDLRKGSPTFLQWHTELLSADNHKTLAIPEGFAHGFQTLTDNCEMLYLHTAAYAADSEAGLNPLDTKLSIPWPMPITEMSQRDAAHALITTGFEGVMP